MKLAIIVKNVYGIVVCVNHDNTCVSFRKRNSALEELIILAILPLTFAVLFQMFGVFHGSSYFIIALLFASGIVYLTTRWLWFDKSGGLGIGIDEYNKKHHDDKYGN